MDTGTSIFIMIVLVLGGIIPVHGIEIVSNGQSTAVIIIGREASEQEWYAAEELKYFIAKFTGAQLNITTVGHPFATPFAILLGTPQSNMYVQDFQDQGWITLNPQLGSEGYILKTVETADVTYLVVAGNSSSGVLYGMYAVVEACITALTGLSPADTDFITGVNPYLSLPDMDEASQPFYPIRATLESEPLDWLTRHRINMSGAEGVWSGTGNDDGLGTAFKYIDASAFEDMQDELRYIRLKRIRNLRKRFDELQRRGIESYLFMYVTGEPTKALIRNHPELLGPEVAYGGARNSRFYRPFCWSKPEFLDMVRRLVQEIVRTYPSLSGFHLRSWGRETRASEFLECGDKSEAGQRLLWRLYGEIIDAAREVRPDFKFYISGYDRQWLKDPGYIHVNTFPPGTISSQKWGADGEPIADPRISIERINAVGQNGRHFLILSHDVEEVMPFWMVESDLFVEGVRKYANNPDVHGLGGFTLQGQNGLSHLDKLVSARINWSPNMDYEALMRNYLANRYQQRAADHILAALRLNGQVLSNYFADYAGSLSLAGKYKRGSGGLATRFWNLVGYKAINDTLAIPSKDIAQYAEERFLGLLPMQQRAENEMTAAAEVLYSVNLEAKYDFEDALHLMQIWTTFFESRLRLAEAVNRGYDGGDEIGIQHKLDSALEYSQKLIFLINSIRKFVPIFYYSSDYARSSLVMAVQSEVEFLQNFNVCDLIKNIAEYHSTNQAQEFDIINVLNYPNPFAENTVFTYILTQDADDLTLSIYTVSGRRVTRIDDVSAFKGYNETSWDGYTEEGKLLANGVYFYKMVAKGDGKTVENVGKLCILR